jgi:nucleotide-binding universal stress UspA family protein
MIQLKQILLPTDFSEYSGEAKKYACALVEKFDAELHVLHVVEKLAATIPEAIAERLPLKTIWRMQKPKPSRN